MKRDASYIISRFVVECCTFAIRKFAEGKPTKKPDSRIKEEMAGQARNDEQFRL